MKFFHIDWLPQTRWGYRLVRRLQNSSDPALKDRFKRYWPTEHSTKRLRPGIGR